METKIVTITCGQALAGLAGYSGLIVWVDEPGAVIEYGPGVTVLIASDGQALITAQPGASWTVTRYSERSELSSERSELSSEYPGATVYRDVWTASEDGVHKEE